MRVRRWPGTFALGGTTPPSWTVSAKGLGGPGVVTDKAVELCHDYGIDLVAGACPLMFLAPVVRFHKVHRTMRHLNGSPARPQEGTTMNQAR